MALTACWHGSAAPPSGPPSSFEGRIHGANVANDLPRSFAELEAALTVRGTALLSAYVIGDVVVDRETGTVVTIARDALGPYLQKWDRLLHDSTRVAVTCQPTPRDVVCFQLGEPELYFHFSGTLPRLGLVGVTEIRTAPAPNVQPPGGFQVIPPPGRVPIIPI